MSAGSLQSKAHGCWGGSGHSPCFLCWRRIRSQPISPCALSSNKSKPYTQESTPFCVFALDPTLFETGREEQDIAGLSPTATPPPDHGGWGRRGKNWFDVTSHPWELGTITLGFLFSFFLFALPTRVTWRRDTGMGSTSSLKTLLAFFNSHLPSVCNLHSHPQS